MEIQEPNTIHERIEMLVDYFCKSNKTAFGRETGILPGILASIIGGRRSKPSFELLQKICARYPEIAGDWLILGRGPMIDSRDTLPIGVNNLTLFGERHALSVAELVDLYAVMLSRQTHTDEILKVIISYLASNTNSAASTQLKELLPKLEAVKSEGESKK